MTEKDNIEQNTMDDSVPIFGTWNKWYLGIIIFNVLFVLFMTYIFSII